MGLAGDRRLWRRRFRRCGVRGEARLCCECPEMRAGTPAVPVGCGGDGTCRTYDGADSEAPAPRRQILHSVQNDMRAVFRGMTMEGGGNDDGIARPHKVDENIGVLGQGVRLAACVYVPRAEAPGLPGSANPGPQSGGARLLGSSTYFHRNWPCRLRPTPWKMKMAAAFGGSEDAGGDARGPSLGPRSPIGVGDRLRGDDEERGRGGDDGGVTTLACQAAAGVIFRGMTSE